MKRLIRPSRCAAGAVRLRMLSSPHPRGFTLIELVISAAIMAIILGAAYACLRSGLDSRTIIETRSDIVQRARVAMDLVTADLRSAYPLSKDFEFLGTHRRIGGIEADQVDFATHHGASSSGIRGDLCEVGYFLNPNAASGTLSLWRRRDTSPEMEPLTGGRRELIADGLTGLRFEYYDGYEWFDEWGDPEGRSRGRDLALLPNNVSGMPDAVRITMWFATEPVSQSGRARDESAAEPSLMFQTVARMNLTPLSSVNASSDSPVDSGSEGQPANPQPGGAP